jgi:hypothetical protein
MKLPLRHCRRSSTAMTSAGNRLRDRGIAALGRTSRASLCTLSAECTLAPGDSLQTVRNKTLFDQDAKARRGQCRCIDLQGNVVAGLGANWACCSTVKTPSADSLWRTGRFRFSPRLGDRQVRFTDVGFSSESILAYNREAGKLAVDPIRGKFCNLLREFPLQLPSPAEPFYSIACANSLSTILTATSQVLISGILGPIGCRRTTSMRQ